MDKGLYALLAADSGIAAITANVFRGAAPPDPQRYPCLTYRFVGGASEPTNDTSGVIRQRVEVNALSFDPEQASDLLAAAIACLNGWQAELGDGTNVLNTLLLNPGTDIDDGEDLLFRRMAEFYVLYTLPS
jgi:hypothetical protein